MKAREPVKSYYRIGEVSQLLGVDTHVLRYWESEFPTIRPQKSKTGQRVYSQQDVDRLVRVKELLRNQGFSIAGARKQLRHAPSEGEEAAVQQAQQFVKDSDPSPRKKSLRKELSALRRELVRMLRELDSEAAPSQGPER